MDGVDNGGMDGVFNWMKIDGVYNWMKREYITDGNRWRI